MLQTGDIITYKHKFFDKNKKDVVQTRVVISKNMFNELRWTNEFMKYFWNKEVHENKSPDPINLQGFVVVGSGDIPAEIWDTTSPVLKPIHGFPDAGPNVGMWHQTINDKIYNHWIEIVDIKKVGGNADEDT